MFIEQRQEKILEILKEHKQVDVSSLATIFDVSEATIRRDLEKLEQNGKLTRTHGGAILDGYQILPNLSTTLQFDSEVEQIGQLAAKLAIDSQTILIGHSRLGLALASNIIAVNPLTIVTNSVQIMQELIAKDNIQVLLIGGLASRKTGYEITSGDFAISMLSNLHVERAFLSVEGVDIDYGLTLNNADEAALLNKMRSISDETILLAENSAFGKKCFVKLGQINECNRIITGSDLSDKYKKYMFENGITLHIGYQI